MAEFGSPTGAAVDPSLRKGDISQTKETLVVKHGESVMLASTGDLGSITEIGYSDDRADLRRIGRVDLGDEGSLKCEVIARVDTNGDVVGYDLVPLTLTQDPQTREMKYLAGITLPLSPITRIGRSKSHVRNDGVTPVQLNYDLSELGMNSRLAGTVSREQVEFTISPEGVSVKNIAESNSSGRAGRFIAERPVAVDQATDTIDNDPEITVPNPNRRRLLEPPTLPPPAVAVELAKPPEQKAKEAQERLEDAEDAVAEALAGPVISTEHADEVIPQPSVEVNSDIVVADAAQAARESVLVQQITDLKNGENVVSHSVTLPEHEEIAAGTGAERIVETEIPSDVNGERLEAEDESTGEEEPEAESKKDEQEQYQDALRAAMESPAALEAALRQGGEDDGASRLKQELSQLARTFKDVENAKLAEVAWKDVVAPELLKISNQDADVMVRSLRNTQQWFENAVKGTDLLRRAVIEGHIDGISYALSNMPMKPSAMVAQLESKQYFSNRGAYEAVADKVSSFDMRAIEEHENIKQIQRNRTEITTEDVAKLHELLKAQGGDMPEINATKNRIASEMPEGDVWRRKMDTVQQLSAMTRRVSLSNFEDDISKLRTQAMNELNDFVQLSRQGRFSNEAINSAMLTLDHIRAKFDEAGNLARIVQNLAAFA
jgi:hypothetical protein